MTGMLDDTSNIANKTATHFFAVKEQKKFFIYIIPRNLFIYIFLWYILSNLRYIITHIFFVKCIFTYFCIIFSLIMTKLVYIDSRQCSEYPRSACIILLKNTLKHTAALAASSILAMPRICHKQATKKLSSLSQQKKAS